MDMVSRSQAWCYICTHVCTINHGMKNEKSCKYAYIQLNTEMDYVSEMQLLSVSAGSLFNIFSPFVFFLKPYFLFFFTSVSNYSTSFIVRCFCLACKMLNISQVEQGRKLYFRSCLINCETLIIIIYRYVVISGFIKFKWLLVFIITGPR